MKDYDYYILSFLDDDCISSNHIGYMEGVQQRKNERSSGGAQTYKDTKKQYRRRNEKIDDEELQNI